MGAAAFTAGFGDFEAARLAGDLDVARLAGDFEPRAGDLEGDLAAARRGAGDRRFRGVAFGPLPASSCPWAMFLGRRQGETGVGLVGVQEICQGVQGGWAGVELGGSE